MDPLKVQLLNPGKLFKDGYNILLAKDGAKVTDSKDCTAMQVSERGNVYPFDLLTLAASATHHTYSTLLEEEHGALLEDVPVAMSVKTRTNLMCWHQ
jgi:hypothetical protein